MIVEGRMIAVILVYIFTFVGFLLGKDIKREQEKMLEKIKIIKDFEKWKKWLKENKDEKEN